jgi:hypothetical protein
MNTYTPSRVLYVDFEVYPATTELPRVEAAFRRDMVSPVVSYMPLQRGTHNVLVCTGSEAIH